MAHTITFELVSPEMLIISESVEMVVVPGSEGNIGVLPGHSPLIATLRPGLIDIHENGKIKDRFFVGGGFTDVSPANCTVLANEAFLIQEVNRPAAEARLKEARRKVEDATEAEITEANRHLTISEALLEMINYVVLNPH